MHQVLGDSIHFIWPAHSRYKPNRFYGVPHISKNRSNTPNTPNAKKKDLFPLTKVSFEEREREREKNVRSANSANSHRVQFLHIFLSAWSRWNIQNNGRRVYHFESIWTEMRMECVNAFKEMISTQTRWKTIHTVYTSSVCRSNVKREKPHRKQYIKCWNGEFYAKCVRTKQ